MLENKTGKSYELLLQNQIFKPYMMNSSTTLRDSISKRLVRGINKSGEKVKNWDLEAMQAAGAILSTVHDLSNFVLANFQPDSILSFQRQKTFTIDHNMGIGLGWFIRKYKNGEQYYWHNGGTGGYTSSMAMDIQSHNSVIILTNIGGIKTVDTICLRLMEAIRNK
jgi:CubicO group peptidase (beta-lactamase class C family)